MPKVLLVTMPFSSTKWPSIGLSLLKPALAREGIECDIRYFNIDFAKMIGLETYEEIAIYPKYFFGERLFALDYFDGEIPDDHEYKKYLKRVYEANGGVIDELNNLFSVQGSIGSFLDHCMASVPWEDYGIVGFTTMFEQNLASLSMAKRLKIRDPYKIIVFGGANCEGVMGLELHRCFPVVDYVCTGEADRTFPEMVRRLFAGESVHEIPGIIYRQGKKSLCGAENPGIENLDQLPFPDYDDYFQQLDQVFGSPKLCYEVHMETSRGCWWGARRQCTFCGLNKQFIEFRSKSTERVLAELSYLIDKYSSRYGFRLISMVDNILNMSFFKNLIPELEKRCLPVKLFYEVKANLNKKQVRMLKQAGIEWVQPGIESLSSHILKLMGKGVSALHNVQLLKHCKECGVYPTWNIIYGSPGETREDYRQMLALMDKITHLVPPEGFIPLCMQRFSRYFKEPDKYGIENVRPEESYRFVYPFSEEERKNLAYCFEYDLRTEVKPPADEVLQLSRAVEYWRECYGRNEDLLLIRTTDESLILEDTRSNARIDCMEIETSHKEIYELCDSIKSFSAICSHIKNKYQKYPVRERDIRDFLEEMVTLNFMARENDNYLSLGISAETSLGRGRHGQ